MHPIHIASSIVSILTIITGIIVLAHDPHKKVHQTFFFLVLSFSIWIGTNLLADISTSESQALFWVKLAIIGPILMPPLFVYFAKYFPRIVPERTISRFVPLFFVAFSATLLFMVPTEYNIESVQIVDDIVKAKSGLLYLFFIPELLASILLSIYILKTKFKFLTKSEKRQTWLVASSLIITATVGMLTNWLLPFLGSHEVASIGPSFSIIITVLTAIAILRNKAFNVTLIATETFIAFILFLLSLEVSFSTTTFEFITRVSIFLAVALMGYFLISNAIKEDKRKKEIQEMAGRLEEKNAELQKLSQLKDDFINIAVHEINTPMTSILGYLSLILEDKMGRVDEKAERYLRQVYTSSKRLSAVVGNFLNSIKIEAGKIKINYSDFDIYALCQEIALEYTEKATKGNNRIFVNSCSLQCMVQADRDKVHEALINIVDNAIKFTKDGKISIDISTDHSDVSISISDTGIGMPKECIKNVFNKFYQIENREMNPCGSGLGLYIVKSIVSMHMGSIDVSSTPNRGTTFTIKIPIKQITDTHEG